MNQLPETGFLRLPQIIGDKKRGIPAIIPVSKSSWWAGCKSGKYPNPVRLGERTTVWRVEDIRTLVEQHSNRASGDRSKLSAIDLAGQA